MQFPTLLSVPNVSEGRSRTVIEAISEAFAAGPRRSDSSAVLQSPTGKARLLDIHSDEDHHRSVYTLAGSPLALADALLRGAQRAIEQIDVMSRTAAPGEAGQHPHVGAIDVVPIVYCDPTDRGAACATALLTADRLGEELHLPVFLYGELTADNPADARTRAELRRGGAAELARRIAASNSSDGGTTTEALQPDFGPHHMHPTAGAVLLAARPPLVAFNLQLTPPGTIEDARRIAALIREGGAEGLPGLRAIGIQLGGDVAQVSMNVERPFDLSLAEVVEAVRRHHALASAELVGLAPKAALEGFPEDLPMPGFDPARHVIENALGSL
jgi:glutamate formiminotransferase